MPTFSAITMIGFTVNKFFVATTVIVSAALAPLTSFAVGVAPTAGDLSGLTPDAASILTAIGAVGVIAIAVTLAIKGFQLVKRMAKSVG